MGFLYFCTGIVLIIFVMFVTALIGKVIDEEDWVKGGWLFSSIGFGICLLSVLTMGGAFK